MHTCIYMYTFMCQVCSVYRILIICFVSRLFKDLPEGQFDINSFSSFHSTWFSRNPPVIKHGNGKSMMNTSIYGGCSIAMFDWRVNPFYKNHESSLITIHHH